MTDTLSCAVTIEVRPNGAPVSQRIRGDAKSTCRVGRQNGLLSLRFVVCGREHVVPLHSGAVTVHKRLLAAEGRASVCASTERKSFQVMFHAPNDRLDLEKFIQLIVCKSVSDQHKEKKRRAEEQEEERKKGENGGGGGGGGGKRFKKEQRRETLMGGPSAFDEISPFSAQERRAMSAMGSAVRAFEKENVQGRALFAVGTKGLLRARHPSSASSSAAKNGVWQAQQQQQQQRQLKPQVEAEHTLTPEQQLVIDTVRSGASVLVTGSAGTGKSWLLHRVMHTLARQKGTAVMAPTGIAACNIGGTTVHQFCGFFDPLSELEECLRKVRCNTAALQRWRSSRTLIVDEVSMLSATMLQRMDEVARALRNTEAPFGGLQMVFFGDFFQLPPVITRAERQHTRLVFAFESVAWAALAPRVFQLTAVFRQQGDAEFIELLQAVRKGRVEERHVQLLRRSGAGADNNSRCKSTTRLCTHVSQVQTINEAALKEQLEMLDDDPAARTFDAHDSQTSASATASLDRATPVPARLQLCRGAQVMLVRNANTRLGLVNGARGVVVGFTRSLGLPIVRFSLPSGPYEATVGPETFTVGSLSRRQLPLALAWAVSIHKSQGMALNSLEVDLKHVFEAGQAYVALSRATSLSALTVTDFEPDAVRAHPKVIAFYQDVL